MVANNQILDEYKTEFQALKHPKNSTQIYWFARVMNSPGNGGNCWYFLGEIRQFTGKKSEISSFYDKEASEYRICQARQV